MIIVKFKGGLGNQMFQYAAGKNLAVKFKTLMKLDLNHFYYSDKRIYQLNIFNISSDKVASNLELSLFKRKPLKLRDKVIYYIQNVLVKKKLLIEPKDNLLYYKEYERAVRNTYLDGYWQNERYFSDIADQIREEFTFAHQPDPKNSFFINEMRSNPSVSLHVRRSDYINDKHTYDVHGTLPVAYYKKGLEILRSKIGNFNLYIFSDDLQWSKENLDFDVPTKFIDHNKENHSEDMRLMSQCKHNIIANSSFSWWGAWLNNNKNKIVIAPVNWFNFSSPYFKNMRKETDIVPESWIKL